MRLYQTPPYRASLNLPECALAVEAAGGHAPIEEVAADKGYHAARTLELCDALGLRTYIPEPKRKHAARWTDKPEAYQRCVYSNRRRVRRAKSKALQRRRSELCERTFAHVCDSGGMRWSWLRGKAKVVKRHLIAVAAHNLGRILRKLFGVGKPRALQGAGGLAALVYLLLADRWDVFATCTAKLPRSRPTPRSIAA